MKRKKNGFGDYLQELRTASGWSLRDLSKASGVSLTHLWSIEQSGWSLRDLSKASGVSLTHLWSIEHDASPKLESLAALSRAFKQPLHRFIRPFG